MALFSKPPETSRLSFALNKRIRSLIIAIAGFLIFVLVLWRRRFFGPPPPPPPELPLQIYPELPDYSLYSSTSEFAPVKIDVEKKSLKELCASFPSHILSRIQPVLKVGHGDDKVKLNAQLDSVSACFKPDELLMFSDLDEKIRNYQAIDVLAHLPESHYNATRFEKFTDYVAMKEMQANGTLDTEAQPRKLRGWDLDKFKFLPMMERAWALKPEKEFYVFYETDTYVFWDNLFRFLETYNPDANVYIGSPSPGRRDPKRASQGTRFANGGPGYVISRGAMKTLLFNRTVNEFGQYTDLPLSAKYSEMNNDKECCGDSVLGYVLWLAGVPMHGHWPMFSPYALWEIPFNDQHWCQPIITLHKTTPKSMVELFKWEFANRKTNRPLTYSDIWSFFKPGTVAERENWDAGRFHEYNPPEDKHIGSFEECGQACKRDLKCLQWKWIGRDESKCILMGTLQQGRARNAEKKVVAAKDTWVDFKAGWMEQRIKDWRESRECNSPMWVGASITRMF